jgi:hypothetical protein
MKGIAKRSVVTPFAAFAVAVTAFAFATPAVAQLDPRPGSTTPVQIIGPLPLPVTGSTTVSGSVAATVTNTDTNPVPVKLVDRPEGGRPFQTRLCTFAEFSGGNSGGCFGTPGSFEVPNGRRMVIEYVSGECSISGGAQVRVGVGTLAGGAGANHRFHLYQDVLDPRFLDLNQQTRIYADAGTTVGISFSAGSGGANPGFARCELVLSGQTFATE